MALLFGGVNSDSAVNEVELKQGVSINEKSNNT